MQKPNLAGIGRTEGQAMKLKDRVAIVTGGSQGIGEAIAIRFASEGARVAIVYHRDDAAADRVVHAIGTAGGTARAVKADCSKIAEIERMVAAVTAVFGTVHILVNNAGVFRTVPVAETTEEIWDEQLDLNLKGAFFCVKAVLPEFVRNGAHEPAKRFNLGDPGDPRQQNPQIPIVCCL